MESDISIVARDEASRALLAVADNVALLNARLIEMSGATDSLKTAQKTADGFFTNLKVAAGAALAYLGTSQLFSFAEKATSAYNLQNKAARSLGDAQVAMAADMQVSLGVADELTLGVMKQAKILGVAEQNLRNVAMATLGLSEATGMGLDASLRKINAAMNGNAGALQEYLPELRNMATEEERLAAVTELAQTGIQKKANSMNYLDGVMKSAANATNNLWEKIGELLEPAIRLTYTAIATFAEVATTAMIPAVEAMGNASEWWANATATATEYVVAAVTAVEVAFNNMGTIVEMGLLTGYLAVLKFGLDVEHTLTVALPAYAMWFADNWVNIFVDMGAATVTVFQNMGRNIGEAAFALFDWIANGFSGGFAGLSQRLSDAVFVGIMDGFEARTASLPEIIERSITGEEQQLANRIGEMGNNLGGKFSEKFGERMEGLKLDKSKFDMNFDLSTTGKTDAGKAASELKAVESRLLTRGKADDPINKVASNTEKTAKELAGLRADMAKNNKPDKSITVKVAGA